MKGVGELRDILNLEARFDLIMRNIDPRLLMPCTTIYDVHIIIISFNVISSISKSTRGKFFGGSKNHVNSSAIPRRVG
jgi:hypothetical protein